MINHILRLAGNKKDQSGEDRMSASPLPEIYRHGSPVPGSSKYYWNNKEVTKADYLRRRNLEPQVWQSHSNAVDAPQSSSAVPNRRTVGQDSESPIPHGIITNFETGISLHYWNGKRVSERRYWDKHKEEEDKVRMRNRAENTANNRYKQIVAKIDAGR